MLRKKDSWSPSRINTILCWIWNQTVESLARAYSSCEHRAEQTSCRDQTEQAHHHYRGWPHTQKSTPCFLPPFPSSLVTSSAQPSSSLSPTLPIVSSDCLKHPSSGSSNAPTTNFNLSHVRQQDAQQSGVTTCSWSKRRREEFETPTSDSQGRKKILAPMPPFHSTQVPTSVAEETNLIDSSTAYSPNSTYCTAFVIEETNSSYLQEDSFC